MISGLDLLCDHTDHLKEKLLKSRILYGLQEELFLLISSGSIVTKYGRILVCTHSSKLTLLSYQERYNLVRQFRIWYRKYHIWQCSRNNDWSKRRNVYSLGRPEKGGGAITVSKREKPRYTGCLRSLGERWDWEEFIDLCVGKAQENCRKTAVAFWTPMPHSRISPVQFTEQEPCIDCMTKAVCGYSLSHVFYSFFLFLSF